jgi:hypothetical protein
VAEQEGDMPKIISNPGTGGDPKKGTGGVNPVHGKGPSTGSKK